MAHPSGYRFADDPGWRRSPGRWPEQATLSMIDVSEHRFEELVGDALDGIPPALAGRMENVVVLVREQSADPGLLGLYEGIPLTERDSGYGGMVTPDRIIIFRRALLAVCETEADVVHQVTITVVHEVGHHFGLDDDRLHELGWG